MGYIEQKSMQYVVLVKENDKPMRYWDSMED
jgi:hypothetical protein